MDRGAAERLFPCPRIRRGRPAHRQGALPQGDVWYPRGGRARPDADAVPGRRAPQPPHTRATVNQLLDRYLEVIELEPTTRQGYVGKIEKHIRPAIGTMQVGRLDAETLERLYAQLRKCREHCHGRKYKEHRTDRTHTCDTRCGPHVCTPLSAASVRVIHSILSGALARAVRGVGSP
jgi:integrase